MPLSAGTRLGPYEILALLGAGGMGEVYRARDTALGRDVAIKVLPGSVAADPDRLRRFEQEARSAGSLNHPNILAIYGFGSHDGSPYVVSELLEGSTLRERMAGTALGPRRATEYAIQIARGLAAAHEKGIVHRDLKPENVFVTNDGRVKILDFGLAKLIDPRIPAEELTASPTAPLETEPGVVMGTVGYFSPEQVRGQTADHRSDIFSFGAVLYEMLTGRRAFKRDSTVETMNAILKEDPPDLSETKATIPPALDRLVRHCLEKSPQQRFQSAHDVAYDLESLSGSSVPAVSAAPVQRKRKRRLAIAGYAAAIGVLLGAAYVAGRRGEQSPIEERVAKNQIRVQYLTFRHGNVLGAAFTPDGQTVVYGAAWEGRPSELYMTRIGATESRPLGIPSATDILSISKSGELAVVLKAKNPLVGDLSGTLARVPLTGGQAREILEDLRGGADWGSDGENLAVVRGSGGLEKPRLEFPIGKKLYEGDGIWGPRVSPKGDHVAFLERSGLSMVDRNGKKTALVKAEGEAWPRDPVWHPSGEEIWFTRFNYPIVGGIFACDLSGRTRLVFPGFGYDTLHGISRDGSVLLERGTGRGGMKFAREGEGPERELSWFDFTNLTDITPDGSAFLFTGPWEGGGNYSRSAYLRRTDGSPPEWLGKGDVVNLSPNGEWALAWLPGPPRQIVLLPVGPGQPRPVSVAPLSNPEDAWLFDDERIIVDAKEKGKELRSWLVDLSGGKRRPVTPEGILVYFRAISPDRRFAFCRRITDQQSFICPLDGGAPRPIDLPAENIPFQWSTTGDLLYYRRWGEFPAAIWRLDLATGKKILWKSLRPADSTGVTNINNVIVTRDGKSYAYTYGRVLSSELLLVTGLK
jgi:hypothetical protein